MTIAIQSAVYIRDYQIRFVFSDNTERVVDFSAFLKNAKNPMTGKYRDKKLFRKFQVVYGDIQWNDYELCFPIWDIYQGKV